MPTLDELTEIEYKDIQVGTILYLHPKEDGLWDKQFCEEAEAGIKASVFSEYKWEFVGESGQKWPITEPEINDRHLLLQLKKPPETTKPMRSRFQLLDD